MSANSSLNQLKKKYRTRYYGYRGRDVSELEPGDNALSFLQQYLHISDSEDEESTATGRSGHFVMQQSGKKKAQSSASKSCGKDVHQHSQDSEDEESTATGRSGHFVMQQSGKKKTQSSASKSCGNDVHQHSQDMEDEESTATGRSGHFVMQQSGKKKAQSSASKSCGKDVHQHSQDSEDEESTATGRSGHFVMQQSGKKKAQSSASKSCGKDVHQHSQDSEDEESTATGRSGHFVMQQSGKKKAQSSTSKSCGNDVHQHSQGAGHSFKKSNTPAVLQKNEKQAVISDTELFSDGESDIEKTYEVAKLIEESLADNDDEDDKNMNISEKPREKLYSSDSSVVREPPSPTSNIHAKKWLSFKEATFSANHSVFANTVSTPSEESRKNAQQLKLQEAIKSNGADITYDLLSEPSDDGLVIEDESSYNLNAWISSSKKKKSAQTPSRAKEDKPTTTPKKAIEAPSSVKKKSENLKESLTSNVTAKRLVIEDESSYKLNAWISSSKKKNASQSPSRAKEDKPTTTPKKAIEAPSSVKKKSENLKESLTSNVTAKRSNEEFVIEDQNGRNFNARNSPFKKKKFSPPAGPKEDSPTPTPKKTETPSTLEKKCETVKASQTFSVVVERVVVPEKKNYVNVRKTSFSDIFFRTAKPGHVPTRLSSVVYEDPATSTAVDNEEEFEIEDLTDTNESHFFKIPVKTKSSQPGHIGKLEKSGRQLQKTDIDARDSESEMITAAVLQVIESPKQHVASSQEVERRERIHQVDILPIESQEEDGSPHTDNSSSNSIEQVQQPQQIRPRTKSDCSAVKIFGDLDETFNITGRKGKGQTKAATKNTKKSKQSEANREEHNVQEKKKKKNAAGPKAQTSSQQGRLSKAGNQSQSVKDLISNDLEPEEILETSMFKCASRKRTHNGEMVEEKNNVEATVSRQSHSESSEMDTCEAPEPVTDVDHRSKKRMAKMKNSSTPCPADHNTEELVFQSGPVLRKRAVLSAEPMKPLPCDLDSADTESEGEEQQISAEDDKPSVSSEEFLKRYSIVFDPDTGSDALVECIAHGDRSEFVGSDYCTYWDSFNNEIFTTGKLVIAPRKKSKRHIFKSKIMVYYVEQGQVQVNLHKSERILKNGDFFFVPPGNSCTITNLQEVEAVLVYNFLNMAALFTEG